MVRANLLQNSLVSCSAYFYTLKLEATCFSQSSVDTQRTTRKMVLFFLIVFEEMSESPLLDTACSRNLVTAIRNWCSPASLLTKYSTLAAISRDGLSALLDNVWTERAAFGYLTALSVETRWSRRTQMTQARESCSFKPADAEIQRLFESNLPLPWAHLIQPHTLFTRISIFIFPSYVCLGPPSVFFIWGFFTKTVYVVLIPYNYILSHAAA
jgi:hypothetical protein